MAMCWRRALRTKAGGDRSRPELQGLEGKDRRTKETGVKAWYVHVSSAPPPFIQ